MKVVPALLTGVAYATAQAVNCSNIDDASVADLLSITPEPYLTNQIGDLAILAATNVDLYVHVLVSKTPADPPQPLVEAKIALLNKNFKPWGYHFNLKDTSVTINADWAAGINNDKAAKEKALHKGDYQTLNVYMVENAKSGVCSLPQSQDKTIDQTSLDSDGCFVPFGPSTNASTLTHEVGHWFGLLHVFQGGCADQDGCDDTAPQVGPSRARPATPGDLGSCPAKQQCDGKGVQNVKNFMDYSDCAQEFTPCQGARMNTMFNQRRKGRKLGAGVQTN